MYLISPLAVWVGFAYMHINSGVLGSTPSAPPDASNGPRARFFVLDRNLRLVAKQDIDV
jgi:hypothetical protein